MRDENDGQDHGHLLVHQPEGTGTIESWLEAGTQLIQHQNQQNRVDDLQPNFLVHRFTCTRDLGYW